MRNDFRYLKTMLQARTREESILAPGRPDVYESRETLRKNGGRRAGEPASVKFGTSVIAFLEEPACYKIKLIERKLQ